MDGRSSGPGFGPSLKTIGIGMPKATSLDVCTGHLRQVLDAPSQRDSQRNRVCRIMQGMTSPVARRFTRLLAVLLAAVLSACASLSELPPEVAPGPPSTTLVAAPDAPLAQAAQAVLA